MKNILNRLFSIFRRLTPWHGFLIFTLLFVQFGSKPFNHWKERGSPFLDDAEQYYAYLPATFIHHHADFDYENGYWGVKGPNGKKVPRFTMGVALMELPFFLAGHAAARIFNYPLTGYSLPYSIALCWAAVFYVLLGMYGLYKALCRFFHPRAVVLTLFLLLYATNLLYYTVSFPLMAHAFSFGLFGIFIYAILRCWKDHHIPSLFTAAATGGMIVLVRSPDTLLLLVPLFFGIHNREAFRNWWSFLIRNGRYTVTALALFLALCLLQPLYWHWISGAWFVNTYGDEGFFFADPQLFNFLFSYRKGLIPYTPLMVLAFIGFGVLYRKNKELFWPLLVFTCVNLYLLSCWWDWSFGGSLGNRALIQSFAVMAFPLAALIHALYTRFVTSRSRTVTTGLLLGMSVLFCAFNFSLIHKYKAGLIHWSNMSREAYWMMMPKWKVTDADREAASHVWRPVPLENFKKGIGRDDNP
ncbi:MAG TPA: hypothetical protein VNZ86_05340 [Bacteroidia bacterium]|nr:hypothetical protein [Bacteroidia bacterium]